MLRSVGIVMRSRSLRNSDPADAGRLVGWQQKVGAMSLTPEALYLELGSLAAEMPEFTTSPTTPETRRWVERAVALVELGGGLADGIQLRVAIENLDGPLRARNAETIASIVRRALARAELDAPPEWRGAFIIADNASEGFAAVRKILGTTKSDVLLVDPHADAKALTDVAVLAPYNVAVRLLADQETHRTSLASAARRWVQRFRDARPLLVRLASAGTLQHTLILVDGTTAWALGQSFNKLAKSAYPALVRMPAHRATPMIAAYEARWQTAEPLSGA